MKYAKLLFVACLMLGALKANAQVNYQQQYINAKSLFKAGRYSLAMETFKPLMQAAPGNDFAAYASFYYAVSAYKDGYPALAKQAFLQLKDKFPASPVVNEVNFWLAKIYFEDQAYNQGINVLKDIKDEAFEENIYNLKYHTFFQIEDLETLKDLYKTQPDEEVVGEVLARKIVRQPIFIQDQQLLNELIQKFKLDEAGLESVKVEKTIFKEVYKVAVLFPLLMEALEPNDRRKVNQLVLDVYQGIQLAVDTLEAKGIDIELLAFDTKRDSAATAQILQNEQMKEMDLIIGPLFSGPRKLVQEFSFKNKINMINPLSTDSDVIELNPYSFLLHPSDETIGKKTAAHVAKKLPKKPGVIFYGETKGDSALAFAYKQKIEEEGFEIIINKKIIRDSSRNIIDILLIKGKEIKEAGDEEAQELFTIAPDSIGHVFVASDNDLITSKVISAMETRGDEVTVVGSAEWFNLPVISYDVYHRLGAVLYAPMYVRKETEAYEKFRANFVRQHRVPPSSFAELGYELMLFMGHSLYEYGKYFQIGWNKESFIPGFMTIGYSYHNAQDNKIVPVLEFGEEGLEIIYEPEEEVNHEDRKK